MPKVGYYASGSNKYETSVATRELGLTYDEQRMAWRRSLSEVIVRSLAADHLRGNNDDDCVDAYAEYITRFGKPNTYTYVQAKRSRKSRERRNRR